ncbi:MAG: hypothetical protein NZP72_13610 [Geminicoccaceae bacterium]|nr:hypothetical protein [Geminicoccaceae bacterium]
MPELARWAGQLLFYGLAALLTGFFATRPVWHQFPKDRAQLTIAFVHGGERKDACKKFAAEEIARLPPRARRPSDCGRERVPLRFELALDGRLLLARTLPPSGISGDGPSRLYEKLALPAGRYAITLRLADSGRAEGFDYERRFDIELRPLENLAIDFRPDRGGFVIR